MALLLKASSFYSIFTRVSKTLNSTVSLLVGFFEASWRCCHNSSGFSLSQFVLLLHVIPDRHDQISVWSTGCCQTPCADNNLTALLQLMTKIMFGNVN